MIARPFIAQIRTPLLLGALLGAITWDAAAEDWPRWRGPNLNGISAEKGWQTAWPAGGPKQLWRASVGTGFASLAVSNGRVYTMGNDAGQDTVHCLDASTGKPIWTHSYPCPVESNNYEGGPNATPTVDGDRVYTLSKRAQLFCLDAASGKVVWSKNLMEQLGVTKPQWGFAGSPLVQGNLVILNVGTAGTAVDKATGKVVWSNGKGAAGYATPVPFTQGNRTGVAIFGAKALLAVDPATGRGLWSYPWETSYDVNSADPIVSGDLFFISSGYNRGCALVRAQGASAANVWENKNMKHHFNPGVLIGGFIYGIDGQSGNGATLNCLDLKTGEIKWSQRGIGSGSLIAADGKLIVLGNQGELIVAEASPTAFKAIARAQVLGGKCWTAPVLANGRIYCRNARGDLVCLDVKGQLGIGRG